jgi:hypothetical protein
MHIRKHSFWLFVSGILSFTLVVTACESQKPAFQTEFTAMVPSPASAPANPYYSGDGVSLDDAFDRHEGCAHNAPYMNYMERVCQKDRPHNG